MAIIIGKIKCIFCGSKKGLISSVAEYGIYGGVGKRIFYHDDCLEHIQEDPEKFGHTMVDMAIKLQDRITSDKKRNVKIVNQFKKDIEKLQVGHFERMMPKQIK